MIKDSIKFTVYIPPEVNDKLKFLRYKEDRSKNQIVLQAIDDYLTKQNERS